MIIWRGCWKYDTVTVYYRIEFANGKYSVKRTHNTSHMQDTWGRSQRDSMFPPDMSTWHGFTEDRAWRLELLA